MSSSPSSLMPPTRSAPCRAIGFADDALRTYTSEQMLAFDKAFRSSHGLVDRALRSLLNDREAVAQYLAYARNGRCALWIRVAERDDANRVIRTLVDHDLVHAWFHGHGGLEVIHIG